MMLKTKFNYTVEITSFFFNKKRNTCLQWMGIVDNYKGFYFYCKNFDDW